MLGWDSNESYSSSLCSVALMNWKLNRKQGLGELWALERVLRTGNCSRAYLIKFSNCTLRMSCLGHKAVRDLILAELNSLMDFPPHALRIFLASEISSFSGRSIPHNRPQTQCISSLIKKKKLIRLYFFLHVWHT